MKKTMKQNVYILFMGFLFVGTAVQTHASSSAAQPLQTRTAKYTFEDLKGPSQDSKEKKSPMITLSDESTISVALRLASTFQNRGENKRIAVINFANAYYPGGAQEGSLRRATTLESELQQMIAADQYPIQDRELFITERGLVVRDDEDLELEKPVELDIISVPAVDLRGSVLSDQEYQDLMYAKIKGQIQAAKMIGADVLVAGAFGCGVFGGDPTVVARLYQKAIQEVGNNLSQIHFAIYGGGENLVTFEKTFKSNK